MQQPAAAGEDRGDRGEGEQGDPDQAGDAGEAGELVGVGVGGAAAAALVLEFDDGAEPAEEQEPGEQVGEGGLDGGGGEPGDQEDGGAGGEDGCGAEGVADQHQHAAEQHQADPQQRGDVAGGEQPGAAEAEQRRGDVAGGAGEDHPGAGRPARRDGHPGGVGMQADAAEPPAGDQGGERVAALVGDGGDVAGDPPGAVGDDRRQRQQPAGQHQPGGRVGL